VPGPDGDYGFGGTCFPKDINSLINIMIDNGVDPLVLKSVWDQNKNYRKNWDWSDNKSAVLKESEV
jgi:UDPglucose 6-dehydrogenase